MAGSLVKVNENILGSDTSSVTLTGIDSTYDVYVFSYNLVIPTVDAGDLLLRFTESGTPNTSANYDRASKGIEPAGAFFNVNATNETHTNLTGSADNNTGKGSSNGILYIFNANNSSEFTFATREGAYLVDNENLSSLVGGNVFTVASAVDGINVFYDFPTANIRSGARFVLYGLKK